MTVVIVIGIVAAILAIVVVGATVLQGVSADRLTLTEQQRAREDDAIEYARGLESRNFEADIVASIFDPFGVFH